MVNNYLIYRPFYQQGRPKPYQHAPEPKICRSIVSADWKQTSSSKYDSYYCGLASPMVPERRMARLTFNTACELGFRGSLDEWERLMGAVPRR